MSEWASMDTGKARDMCLLMYVGAECKFCKHRYESIEDIKNKEVVCAENNGNGLKFACKKCFDANQDLNEGGGE